VYDLGARHTIDVLDPSRLCQCRFSRLVRRWHRSPSFAADPCGYLKFLSRRLAAEKYDVLLPLHDEIFLLSRVRNLLAERVAVAMADFASVALLQSKLQFFELARELNLRCPATHVVTRPAELSSWEYFPVFVKLDYGTAGQTVRLVHDGRELDAALADFESHGWWTAGDPVLLQQPAAGEQGVVRGIFCHGNLVAAHSTVLRVRGVGGAATVREGIDLPAVTADIRRLGERLAWHGPLFGEFFFDAATKTPQYIEFNPRIGDSANAFFSGVNLMQHWVDVAMANDCGLQSNQSAIRNPQSAIQTGVSTHAAMLMLMSQAMEGAGRRELWREIRRQWRGVGLYGTSHDELTRPRQDWLSTIPYAWVASRLLARPASAHSVVGRTVKNYALTTEAAQRIRNLPQERLEECFS
jgi:predicted ATP-grasp superfamily ATP-dependent carboligase